MATITSLYPKVQRFISNCPSPVMKEAFIVAAREFCRDSRFFRETQLIDIVADQVSYLLVAATTDAEVIGLKAAEFDEEPIDGSAFEQYEQESGGRTDFYSFEPPATLWLNDIPTVATEDGLAVRLILQPKLDAATLHDSLLRKYDDVISAGAVAYLAGMTKRGWTDPNIYAMQRGIFMKGMETAKADSDRGFRSRGFRTKKHP